MPSDLRPPPSFAPFDRINPLLEPWGPIYACYDTAGLTLGVFVREPHVNSRRVAHGGFLAALADTAMGISCGVRLRSKGETFESFWTTSLTIDYLGRAELGQWLTFSPGHIHPGRTLCHAEADIQADWTTIGRARAAFRVVRPRHVSSSS